MTAVIPAEIIVGVTGTRQLPEDPVIGERIREVLVRLPNLLPPLAATPTRLVALSPLAEGADRLLAQEVLASLDGALEVVLPLDEADYRTDFGSAGSSEEFERLLGRARRASRLTPHAERPRAYTQVGRYVVDHCDVLIAVWDGLPAAGKGGTAEVVQYARELGRPIFWIHTEKEYRLTEEAGQGLTPIPFEQIDRYNQERLSPSMVRQEDQKLRDHVESIADAVGLDRGALAGSIDQLLPHFLRADLLAQRYQRRYQRAGTAIYALAAISVAMSAFQVLWHENPGLGLASAVGELLFMTTILVLLWRGAKRSWQSKWIDYRFLAERIRTAFLMNLAGVQIAATRPPRHLSLSYSATDWMVAAFRAACGSGAWIAPDDSAERQAFVRRAWIEDQLTHHERSSERNHRAHVRLSTLGNALFGLTFLGAALYFVPGTPERLLSWITITFPALGGTLAAIRTHREYHRISARSSEMAGHLRDIRAALRTVSDPSEFRTILREAEEVMANENADWRVVVRFHELEAA